jgi:hypothetical protein
MQHKNRYSYEAMVEAFHHSIYDHWTRTAATPNDSFYFISTDYN